MFVFLYNKNNNIHLYCAKSDLHMERGIIFQPPPIKLKNSFFLLIFTPVAVLV